MIDKNVLEHPQWDDLSDTICTVTSAFYPPPIPPAVGQTIARPKRRPKHFTSILYLYFYVCKCKNKNKQIKTTQLNGNSKFT